MGITCNNNSTKHKKNVIKVNNISEKSINLIKLIRSKYIITDIFSYLPEEKKLKIISYNKKLQNYLDIDIKNYKIISDRYRVGNRNGKGKEYDSNDYLIFEGHYLNGKRNGKGKEYDILNKKIFEGEYLNGKRNGKGKEYYSFRHRLKYKGEYLNGKRWNGKGYNYNDNE